MRITISWLGLAVASLGAVPGEAYAQRTGDNVVTQSGDAFGRSVGNEKSGLYNQDDVRGFSPVDAGNVRIEGLYFDQMDRVPMRLIDGNSVRVGISAQRYPFPAPTGLLDYGLTKAGDRYEGSVELERGPYGGFAGALEFKLPLAGEKLGLSGGVGGRDQSRTEGGRNQFRNAGLSLVWRPAPDAEILAFAGGYNNRGEEARVTYYPTSAGLPPKVRPERFMGQDWADRNTDSTTFGLLVHLPLAGMKLEAGLFDSRRKISETYSDLLTGVTPDGRAARRTIVADGNNHDESLSGEMRLVKTITTGTVRHKITASLRGRRKDRLFGGTQNIQLGPSSILIPDPRPRPVITLGADNQDKVRQMTFGLAYSVEWAKHGALDFGLSKSRYRKSVDWADPTLPTIRTADDPLLWNVGGTLHISNKLAAYGGFVRGQEEALVAPDIASNRSEAPPAIRTRQVEAGLRYKLTDHLTLVAGAFSVKKPYYNLDPALRYRQLGMVDNRGLEFSLAGQVRPGLSIIAGSLFLSPRISGEAVDQGLIGQRPVGQPKRRTVANLDWRAQGGKGSLSLDLALESYGTRAGNALNTLTVPSRESLNIGARYRFNMLGKKALIRPQVQNLFNDFGWEVSSSGGYTFAKSRTFITQLVIDY